MTVNNQDQVEPKLAPPGAGVSWLQRQVLKYVVGPRVAAKSDWDADTQRFTATCAEMLQLVAPLNNVQLQTRVLVPKQAGLEDSSRYWSAAMVLEHVMIVGTGIRDIVIRLSQGAVPPGHVDTARVKPQGVRAAQDTMIDFETFAHTLPAHLAAGVRDKTSPTVMAHPWFGNFTAHQWHWLLATHNDIHVKQLKAIIAGLPR